VRFSKPKPFEIPGNGLSCTVTADLGVKVANLDLMMLAGVVGADRTYLAQTVHHLAFPIEIHQLRLYAEFVACCETSILTLVPPRTLPPLNTS